MQAKTNDRFHNVQIFAGLLRCIRKICVERLIGHLTIVDIKDVSQSWYRDFFKLAGFQHCRCQSSAGSTLQLETRNCIALTGSLDQGFSTVYETVSIWLAEGRCTRALLDSAASGEAAEVERRYFHDLLAVFGNEKNLQSAQGHVEVVARDRTHGQRPSKMSVRRSATSRRNALEPWTSFKSSRKHWSNQDAVDKSIGGPASRVRKKRRTVSGIKASRKKAFEVQEGYETRKFGSRW